MFSKNIKNMIFITAFLIILYGAYNAMFNVQEGIKKRIPKCFSNGNSRHGMCNKLFVKNPPSTINEQDYIRKFDNAYDSCNGNFECQNCVMTKATLLDPNNNKQISEELLQVSGDIIDFVKNTQGKCNLTENEKRILKTKRDYLLKPS